MRRKLINTLLTVLTLAALAVAEPTQQPREQGPAPATCEQALRENSAMRDRIASLERQQDATNEEAKTYYIRAAHLEHALTGAERLAGHYRESAARAWDRVREVEHRLDAAEARARRDVDHRRSRRRR